MATLAKLETNSKRAEIIEMRFRGHTLQQVGDKLGMTLQGVKYHEDAWLAEQKPSSEVTEARRQVQLAAVDAVRARLFAALDAELEVAVRLAIVDRLEKLWNREARLLGLDLQPGIQVGVFTAEAMASAFGWDVEAQAVEIVDAPAQLTEGDA